MSSFTKRKFLQLETRVQHKKCALLLREIYESLVAGEQVNSLFEEYHEKIEWMKLDHFFSNNIHEIADRYHDHLKESLISLKEHNLLPPIRKGDHQPKEGFGTHAIYLDRMRSAYNVGSILRTVEALRIGPIYFHEKTPFIDNDKVIKTSMGASSLVPCYRISSLDELPRPLIALETAEDAEDVTSFIFPPSCTIVVGNEESGISDELLSMCDYFIELPLFGAKNSINAACALGIAAAQIRRQKKGLSKISSIS